MMKPSTFNFFEAPIHLDYRLLKNFDTELPAMEKTIEI